ncbi:metal ABC transporter substrate-binding protein [Tepidimicrobium xylanilyticum]|uniref:Zinc transport system substrate-binding protein n=1 Tax=Tepidimicrobium xylanilyticum TaxID=1123352 RepID=A0A1H2TY36_9FIRM|nr:zinc ABC transporter substrate-binding protein [Tepidimicrobium xylanilyticum]GMG98050.1 adhesin [Tepidimicrobium xylanilyticum]SDW48668.1 zinc transport system substrate-binding protein [Tepidimicrobium xylanilyticum]
MKRIIMIIIVLSIFVTGCERKEEIAQVLDGKPIVYTSFYPLYFLANEIGKAKIDLRVVIPNGVDSHHYEPSLNQLKDIEKAHLFIYNGLDFESWTEKLIDTIIDKDKTLNASEYVELIQIDGHMDPHIWLSPHNMKIIGEKIKDRLIQIDKENKDYYEENYSILSDRLEALDRDYKEVLNEKKRDTILVSHAAFSYMGERYGFKQISVAGISPEQEPSPKTIAEIIDLVKEDGFEYIFLETLASPKTVDIIANEADLKVLILNPIEGLTEEEEAKGEDYISIMEENLKNLKKALVD